jgi:hypothetical protein
MSIFRGATHPAMGAKDGMAKSSRLTYDVQKGQQTKSFD